MKDSKKRSRQGFISIIWRSKEETNKVDKNLSQKTALIGNLSRNKYQPEMYLMSKN